MFQVFEDLVGSWKLKRKMEAKRRIRAEDAKNFIAKHTWDPQYREVPPSGTTSKP